MRKLFLTSGIILSMVSQASASTDINYSNNSYSASACTYPYLDTYESSSSLEAKWDANISGKITLNSNRFANSGASTAATTANTPAALAEVYAKYGTGIYSSTANATSETNAITALTTMPVMTGYNFQGFYTGKAGSGTPVINSSGNYLDAAKTQITSSGAQATWYAHWTAKNDITVSYAAGTAKNTANASSATHTPTGSTASQTATYDSSLTLAANGFTAPAGYTFNKWSSPKVLTTGASSTTQYSASASISPWKVADNITLTATWTPINYTITYQDTTSDSMGTALNGSLTGSIPAAQTISYDNKVNLTSMTGTRTGYSFQGWSGNKNVRALDGTGNMAYSNGESVTYIYPGNATLTAVWNPNKSGAITLVSSVYPGNDTSQTATYTTTTTEAVTPATTSTIYSVYNNGLYKDSSHGTPIVASEEIPVKAGYTFGGFYNSSMTDQYITDAGAATDKGKRAVTANNGTATWYAKWTAKKYNVIYNKGTCTYGSGQSTAYTDSNAATYDTNWTPLSASLSAAPKIGAPATGWTFDGWTTSSTPTYSSNTLQNKVTGYSPWKRTSDLTLYGACTPNISGKITLDSKRYAASNSSDGTAATTNASAATLYSVYEYGMYKTQPNKGNYTTATKYTALATAPVQTGYTFAGFYTGKAGSGIQVIKSDKTFTDAATTQVTTAGGTDKWYAHYTANTYNVTYAADGTGCTGTSVTHTSGATYNATYTPLTFGATTPVNISGITAKTGYHFYQWNDGTTNRPAGTGFTWTYTSAKTLTSVCKGNISGAIKLDSKKYESSTATSGTNPTTEGNPTAVYSVYKQGIYAALPTDAAPGTALTTITVPTLTGYTFGGYYTTKTGTGTQLIDGEGNVLAVANQQVTTAGATPTWYAKWTANTSTITYTCGTKPSGASTNITGTAPSTVTNQAYDAQYTLASTANTCALPGYHFNGWSCDYNLASGAHTTTSYAGGASGTFKSTSNVTCAAVWEANTIDLNWSANGGTAQDGSAYTVGSSSQSCVYDSSLTVPSAPKKDGYTFTGWTVTSTNP